MVVTVKWNCWFHNNHRLTFLGNSNRFWEWLAHLSLNCREVPHQSLVMAILFKFNHFGRGLKASYYGFKLHFLITNNPENLALCLIIIQYFVWQSISSNMLAIFIKLFLLIHYKKSLYTLDTNPLSEIWFFIYLPSFFHCLV